MKSLLVAFSVVFLLTGLAQAQGKGEGPPSTPPGHIDGHPGRGKASQPAPNGPKSPKGGTSVAAPEFDPRSAGAFASLIIGGSLVLLESRRRRKSVNV